MQGKDGGAGRGHGAADAEPAADLPQEGEDAGGVTAPPLCPCSVASCGVLRPLEVPLAPVMTTLRDLMMCCDLLCLRPFYFGV